MRTAGRFPTCPRAAVLLLLLVASLVLPGCALYYYQAPIRCDPSTPGQSPIGRALDYLDQTQVKSVVRPLAGGADFPGNWPQYLLVNSPIRTRVREVSPFLPAFIHHSLALFHEKNQAVLGLNDQQIRRARAMRRASVEFMHRFEARPEAPDAGAYGFWLRLEDCTPWRKPWLGWLRGDWMAKPYFWLFMDDPVIHGPLHCLNLPQIPDAYGVHPDSDTTAVIYSVFWDAQRLDGRSEPAPPFHLFEDWRDSGKASLRIKPDWLPKSSGAFLTYFAPTKNDVDLVVNANILYMLARFGRLDSTGAAEAQQLIAEVLPRFLDGEYRDDIHLNYFNPMMEFYCIARACREGPVPGLEPALARIAEEVRHLALRREEGYVHWDCGQPDLDTAFGILILLAADKHLDLIPSAVRYLLDHQDPRRGNWQEGATFGGETSRGHKLDWVSAPFSTAMALEALCRFRLAAENMAHPEWQDLATQVVSPESPPLSSSMSLRQNAAQIQNPKHIGR